MASSKGFKDLIVWQKAYQLALASYKTCQTFPKYEMYGLGQQMQRCGVSVPSNIAEGYGRQYDKEYKHFLSIAYGSLCEFETQYLLAIDLGYTTKNEIIEGLMTEIGRMLYKMINPSNS